jgi:hypothetical protein
MVEMVEAIPALKGLLDYFAKGRQIRSAKKDQALTALYAAATETKLYLEKLNDNGRRNRRTEEQLVRLWSRAAIPVRHFDRALADRCLAKSQYWISPGRWTEQEVEENCIGIRQIHDAARRLLLA